MSNLNGRNLSVKEDDVRQFIDEHLSKIVESAWLVGSRSKRKNKVPRPDSDWDLKVQANDEIVLPNPRMFGIHMCIFRLRGEPPEGAIQLYPKWLYK